MLLKSQNEQEVQVNWSDIDGASPKPKRLHLEKDETDSLYHYQYKSVTMMDFMVKEGAENMLITSTVILVFLLF